MKKVKLTPKEQSQKKNRQKIYHQIDNLWAKYRSMIWINLFTLLFLLIFLVLSRELLAFFLSKNQWPFYLFFGFFIFFYNLGYFAMYKLSKQLIIYNLVCFVLMVIASVLVVFKGPSEFQTQKILLVVGLYLGLIPLTIATFIGFKRAKTVTNYLGFKETLFDLSKLKFKVNGEFKDLRIFLKEGHFYLEVNQTRKKFSVDHLKNLEYRCATIFNRPGRIKFQIGEWELEYVYYSALEDSMMFALAYNIVRVNKKAMDFHHHSEGIHE